MKPDINEEFTDTDEKISQYLEEYCQEGFIPSWMNAPKLSDEDLFFGGLAKSYLRNLGLSINPRNSLYNRPLKIGFNLNFFDLFSDNGVLNIQVQDTILDCKFVKEYFNMNELYSMIKTRRPDNFFSKLCFNLFCAGLLEEVLE